MPEVLAVDESGNSQGDYDLAIAVDPQNVDLVYLAGSYAKMAAYPGSIWRCSVKKNGANYRVANATSIGTHAHADVPSEPPSLSGPRNSS